MPPEIQPVLAAVVSVASLILLVTRLRVHPFPGLLIASFILGFLAGLVPTEIIKNFGKGFGDVMGSVGIIIGLGTMLGGVLVVSGGADRLAISLTSIGGKHWVPWTTFFVALLIGLPPVLMLGRSVAELAKPAGVIKQAIDFLGDPITALLVALFFSIAALGFRRGWSAGKALEVVGNSLAPIAAVVFIVGAGGGFKQMLIATKISDLVGVWAAHANISPLLLGWAVAALVRIATGSATVATITAAGLVAQIVEHDLTVNRELMVLATGSGSLILSHVNDAGFWLVKEYFGLTVVETFKSWTVMETILSVLGLVFVLGLSLVIR
jgi:H+/gluconate symporter-like permease